MNLKVAGNEGDYVVQCGFITSPGSQILLYVAKTDPLILTKLCNLLVNNCIV